MIRKGFFALPAFGVHSNSILMEPRITTERFHPTGKVERSWEFEGEVAKTRYGSWLQYLQYLRASLPTSHCSVRINYLRLESATRIIYSSIFF